MSWINEHDNIGRVTVLVLLLVAIMGPWTYSPDGAPPAEWCREPFILLEKDRCVGLVSGATVIIFMTRALFSLSAGLLMGATVLPDRARELFGTFLFVVLLFLLVLPVFTTLLLIRRAGSRRLRPFHLAALGVATVLSVLPVLFDSALHSGRFWGIWLYIGVAASVLILEVRALVAGSRPITG
jgi:hypothetical protein